MDATTAQAIQSYTSIGLTLLTAGTLCVLIWYTIETQKLRRASQTQIQEAQKLLKEAQRQNEISVKPMVDVYVGATGGPKLFFFRNIGFGPAFNIVIPHQRFQNGQLMVSAGLNVLPPGKDHGSLSFQFHEGQTVTALDVDALYYWINTGKLPNPLQLSLHFKSMHSQEYAATFRFEPANGHLRILFHSMEQVTPVPTTP